jgi:aspartate dehydrogenase
MATAAAGLQASEARRVAIAGLGAIGEAVVQAFAKGIEGLELAAVAARDKAKAEAKLARFGMQVPVVRIADLEPLADIVVECAPASVLPEIAEPFLKRGKTVVVLSCGALLRNDHLLELARTHKGQIIVPTGALIGLDAVTAAAEGQIRSVRMMTRKPPRGLEGAPYIKEHGIDLSRIAEPTKIFSGSPREAAVGFPANLNVAVALSLAGIGPDRTQLELWADPNVDRNVHRIEVEADSASFAVEIANVPSENPRTGRITALSVIACLRKLEAPLRIGT